MSLNESYEDNGHLDNFYDHEDVDEEDNVNEDNNDDQVNYKQIKPKGMQGVAVKNDYVDLIYENNDDDSGKIPLLTKQLKNPMSLIMITHLIQKSIIKWTKTLNSAVIDQSEHLPGQSAQITRRVFPVLI